MNHRITPLALLLTAACAGVENQLTAQDQLLLDAIAGEEDPIARGASDGGEGPVGPPPMQRECDSEGTYTGLFSHYDADGSTELEKGECGEVDADHARMDDRRRMDLLRVLTLVYDTDGDGVLADDERAPLLEDFTSRCGVLQDRLLADFDGDGDGDLSESELETAHETLRAEHDQLRGECGCDGEMERPPPGGSGMGAPPEGDRPDEPPPSCFVDTLVAEFDGDGDGELSATEREELRVTVRERILAGLPFHAEP